MTPRPQADAAVNAALPAWASGLWPAPTEPLLRPRTASRPERRIEFTPMLESDLDAVQAVESQAYAHPWSRRHFHDSLKAGYPAMLLLAEALPGEVVHPPRADGRVLLGYMVAMPGVEEVHLLNITVAVAHQRQGWARFMLDALALWSRGQGAQWLWLEVRQGNVPARGLYERCGFAQVGVRKGYYPAGHFQREDAVVMSLNLVAAAAVEAAR
jgi:ribosomal-protein-alanine N-acetyltransferase